MDAWLYKFLNAEAKAWPYYRHDRAKQLRSIRDHLRMVRSVLATTDSLCKVSYDGDVSVQYEEPQSNGLWSSCSCSGMSLDWAAVFIRLGVPTIDCRPADFGKLVRVAVSGPMNAVGHQPVDAEPHALGYRPLREVAKAYQDAGCFVVNLFEDMIPVR